MWSSFGGHPILIHSSIPVSPLPSSFLGSYNLETLLLVCRQSFIAMIVVLLSMLAICIFSSDTALHHFSWCEKSGSLPRSFWFFYPCWHFFTQIQPCNITACVQISLHCQECPGSSIHAGHFLHCPVHHPTVVNRTTSTAQVLIPPIKRPPFSFDVHNFLTLVIYSDIILPFMLVLRFWSNCKMPRYL